MSCVHVAMGGAHLAVFVLADKLRVDAQQLGGMAVIAEVLPQDKDGVIR